MSFYLYSAPMQGHTDAAWRHYHAEVYGGADAYFTPFIRVERKSVRPKDMREIESDLNENHLLIPQLIFSGTEELEFLLDKIAEAGYTEADLNIGCPYPMQTNHGRGAAMVACPEKLSEVLDITRRRQDISFSLKMRAGLESHDEWKVVLPIINEAQLSHVTFHPRVAKQKYDGELDMEAFEGFLQECVHPVVFNGDLRRPDEILAMHARYGNLAGIMTGRGLLGRPSLLAEFKEGEWSHQKRLEKMLDFHNALRAHFEPRLCGDKQLLERLSAFWEYAEPEIDRKTRKLLQKASSMAKYEAALARIPSDCL